MALRTPFWVDKKVASALKERYERTQRHNAHRVPERAPPPPCEQGQARGWCGYTMLLAALCESGRPHIAVKGVPYLEAPCVCAESFEARPHGHRAGLDSPAQRPIFETAQEPQRLLAGTWLMCFPGTGNLSAWHA